MPVKIAVITPAFNEKDNLPLLYDRLVQVFAPMDVEWEWIIIDDHSRDTTFDVARGLSQRDGRVRAIRVSRNVGSHMSICAGLDHSDSDCAVIMASDLQDPPELIPQLLESWKEGHHVVWATRRRRPDTPKWRIAVTKLYSVILHKLGNVEHYPMAGADFMMIDRRVMDAVRRITEHNVSTFVLIAWMGFKQTSVIYDKENRVHGESGWTFAKTVKIAIDTFLSFSSFPIRVMSYLGFVTAFLGFLYALVVIGTVIAGNGVDGWASLMVVVLIIGGVLMSMLGVLGEYVWRLLDEGRNRPRYIIQDAAGTFSSYPPHHRAPTARLSNEK